MTVLFPKWTNHIPALLALGAGVVGLSVVFIVSFWFSPKHTDVGYQPFQPIPYSHKLHAGSLGMDCRYCHRNVEEGACASVPDASSSSGRGCFPSRTCAGRPADGSASAARETPAAPRSPRAHFRTW